MLLNFSVLSILFDINLGGDMIRYLFLTLALLGCGEETVDTGEVEKNEHDAQT